MKKYLLFSLLLLPSQLLAEPYMAIRGITLGLKCSSCHVNRTGGGQRTGMGAVHGVTDLPWKKIEVKVMHWTLFDDLISFGADFRFLNQTTFLEENTMNTFQTDKANVYLSVRLVPDRVSLHLDESIAPGGAQSREVFGLVDLPASGWLKGGKFLLPYGLRLEDDRAFIREVPGINYTTPDLGFEVGFEPGKWTIVSSFTNGTSGSIDTNTSKQVVGTLAYVSDSFRLGASGSYNSGAESSKNSAAIWGGFRYGRAVFLTEVDFVRDEITSVQKRSRIVTYAETDFLIGNGWNLKAAYEYYDPDVDIEENQRDRIIIGIEPFLAPFIQAALFYRFNQSIPQNRAQNADELTFRFHIYF